MPAADPGPSAETEIATTTLAEIYVQQGLYERALAIYRRIALRSPQDARVAERIEDLTRRLRGEDETDEEGDEEAVEIPVPVDDAPEESEPAEEAAAAGMARAIPVPAEEVARGAPAVEPEAPPAEPPAAPIPPRPPTDEEFAAWLAGR